MILYTFLLGFPGGSVVKESACNAGDAGSIPGWGRSPGEGSGNPLHYSCLENPMDREAWWARVPRVKRVGNDLVSKPPWAYLSTVFTLCVRWVVHVHIQRYICNTSFYLIENRLGVYYISNSSNELSLKAHCAFKFDCSHVYCLHSFLCKMWEKLPL